MDLHTGKSNWVDSLPYAPSFPALEQDATCDVLVVGAGECGALCAFELVSRGLDVIVVDKRKAVSGISSANTGMLQAASDKPLHSYIHSLGPDRGVRIYRLCRQAIDHLERIASMLEFDCQFKRRDSLYFASTGEDVPGLKKEYETLASYGFDADYWDESAIGDRFSFRKPAALYSRNDAEFNPYRFVNALLLYVSRQGARIFEHTEVIRHSTDKESIVFHTPNHRIRAQYAVIAAGYEAQEWQRNPNAVMSSTFAVATQRLDDFPGWPGRCMIWETARPYLYIRTTADNRIVAGGLDERTGSGTERERMLRHKSDLLIERLRQLFPRIPDLRADYSWTAVFGSTHDSLPLIGPQESFPRCYFALGYGGNGSVYSTIASQLIAGLLIEGRHPDAELFRFDRPERDMGVSI